MNNGNSQHAHGDGVCFLIGQVFSAMKKNNVQFAYDSDGCLSITAGDDIIVLSESASIRLQAFLSQVLPDKKLAEAER